MPILAKGMPCPICGQPMREADGLVWLGCFSANPADPLFELSDAVAHRHCLDRHPLAPAIRARQCEWERLAHLPPCCRLCGNAIERSEDGVVLPHLTDDPTDPLADYNYLAVHLVCFADWAERDWLLGLLEQMTKTGRWRGEGLTQIVAGLRTGRESPP